MKNKKFKKILIILLSICLFSNITPCYINEEKNGYCIEKENVLDEVNFCKEYLPENICIPFKNVIKIKI